MLLITVYGTMESRMEKIESQVMPVPPNLLRSLRMGFDAVANQIVIIIIPIAIDLLLWLGPHLQIKTLINNFLSASLAADQATSLQTGDLIISGTEMIRSIAKGFNLLSLLRTIPVGIPSLMAGGMHTETPNGIPASIDIINPIIATVIALGLILFGLIAGSFYYRLVVQVALKGKIELKTILHDWSWTSLQVLSLALAFLILLLAVSVPSLCVIFAIALFGLPLAQFASFLYLGFLLWLAFPLLFSAHGIFVNHNNALAAVQRSMTLTKMTLPATSLFILVLLALSEGLDFLWHVPPETSWLMLIGVGGHAFITSALLAASFVYYRDADLWVQETLRMIKSQSGMPLSGR
jgi:hypothetical protein